MNKKSLFDRPDNDHMGDISTDESVAVLEDEEKKYLEKLEKKSPTTNEGLDTSCVTCETLACNALGKVRREVVNGREFLVAPLTMIVPGVLNGSQGPLLYVGEENHRNVDSWNGLPMVVQHPTMNGKPSSGRTPHALAKQEIGRVYNAKTGSDDKLRGEGWFDVEASDRIDPTITQRLRRGDPIELSTGLYTRNEPNRGEFNGRQYTHIARDYRPDHLAILPDRRGACSIPDGCGVLVNEDGSPTTNTQRTAMSSLATAVLNMMYPSTKMKKEGMTPEKACKIMEDGETNGKKLSKKQKGMFGALCGQRPRPTSNKTPEQPDNTTTNETSNTNLPPENGVGNEELCVNCEGMKKCGGCAAKAAKMEAEKVLNNMKCSKCGATMETGDRICKKCGWEIPANEGEGKFQQSKNPATPHVIEDMKPIVTKNEEEQLVINESTSSHPLADALMTWVRNCGGPGSGIPGPCPSGAAKAKGSTPPRTTGSMFQKKTSPSAPTKKPIVGKAFSKPGTTTKPVARTSPKTPVASKPKTVLKVSKAQLKAAKKLVEAREAAKKSGNTKAATKANDKLRKIVEQAKVREKMGGAKQEKAHKESLDRARASKFGETKKGALDSKAKSAAKEKREARQEGAAKVRGVEGRKGLLSQRKADRKEAQQERTERKAVESVKAKGKDLRAAGANVKAITKAQGTYDREKKRAADLSIPRAQRQKAADKANKASKLIRKAAGKAAARLKPK